MTPSLKKHLAESEKQLLSLRHEYKIFMGAVANWFESHPDLTGGTVGKPKCVHSVRSRLKNEDHLREKLKRKTTDDAPITADNVCHRITDVAGVRVLHFHQSQFAELNRCIREKIDGQRDWVLHEPPKAYTWDPESKVYFESLGVETQIKDSFYTSVHFVVKPRLDSSISCEIQVRTLFEEIWGEVDHMLNYPSPSESQSCREQLLVLAKLVGAGSRLVDSIFRSAMEESAKTRRVRTRGASNVE